MDGKVKKRGSEPPNTIASKWPVSEGGGGFLEVPLAKKKEGHNKQEAGGERGKLLGIEPISMRREREGWGSIDRPCFSVVAPW